MPGGFFVSSASMHGKPPNRPHWGSLQLSPEIVLDHLWGSSIVCLALVGEDGKWIHPSPSLCELLEYTQAELERMTYMDITHPLDVTSDIEMAKAVAKGVMPHYTMSKRYITKTGKTIWIKLHVSGFFDEEGKFLMFLSQIAPAEIYNPSAPNVARTIPLETRIKNFLVKHWWKLIPLMAGLGAGIYEAVVMHQRVRQILDSQ